MPDERGWAEVKYRHDFTAQEPLASNPTAVANPEEQLFRSSPNLGYE